MKKYLFIGLLAFAAAFMTSCRYCNCDHPGGDVECKYHAKTINLVVAQNEWKFDDTNKQYYVRFPVQELTADVLKYGNISVHHVYNPGTNDEFQTGLPETLYFWEDVTNNGTTETVYYQQLIDYMAGIGYVEISLTNNDFFYTGFTPAGMTFHLQLIY